MKNIDKVATFWQRQLSNDFSLFSGEEVYFRSLLNIARNSNKILEVGVGKGRMVSILRNNGIEAEFHGVDITENAKQSGTLAVIGDARKLPFPDNTFDLVYSLGVIEHFPETFSAVTEHARVAKNGGHVLITTPHLSVFTPLRYMFHFMNDWRYGSFEEIQGRNIKLKVMKQYFTDSGLYINDYGVYGMFGIKRILRKLKLQIIQNRLQEKIPIGAFLYVIGIKRG